MNDASAGGLEQIAKLARAAKIRRLVWIDDKFGQRDLARVARAIRTKIEVFWRLAPEQPLPHTALARIPRGSDPDMIEGVVLTTLQGMRDKDDPGQELLNSLDQEITFLDEGHQLPVKDLNPQQFKEIERVFQQGGAVVEALALHDWIDRREEICGNLADDDLFFIDQDFSSEEGGSRDSGEEILSYLLDQPKQTFACIFFTHAVDTASASQAGEQIAKNINKTNSRYRFAVVSKESLTAADGGGYTALRLAFKEAFLKDWCFSIAERSKNAVTEAFEQTTSTLLTLNVDELAAAFFRKAFTDGTLEPDVLLRLFFLAARIKLQDDRSKDQTLWKRLSKIRSLLVETADDRLQSPINPTLQKWHERETFDPARVVNDNFSPVFLGDVFVVERGEGVDHYVLIAQPCDLIIRDTSRRNNNEGLFLKISTKEPKNESFGYRFQFPELGCRWIHYSNSIPVNLNLLDVVSFRRDGKLLFNRDLEPSEMMLPGVLKKFEQLQRSFGALFKPSGERTGEQLGAKYRRFSLSNFAGGDDPLNEGHIELPITRIGRIRSPHAEAILAGFAVYHTRVAFDYDFSDLSAFVEKRADKPPLAHAEDKQGRPAEPGQ